MRRIPSDAHAGRARRPLLTEAPRIVATTIPLAAEPARRVYDVTGAGDTAAAALALGLAAGFTIELAARVANVAAGLAVCKVGTAVVRPDELLAALLEVTLDYEPFTT